MVLDNGMANSGGLMEDPMMGSGDKVNNMARAYTQLLTVFLNTEYGRMVENRGGYHRMSL